MPAITPKRRAVVTGASGFVGRALCHRLLDEGWELHAMARGREGLAPLRERGAHCHCGDITDVTAVSEATPPESDLFFHVAGDTGLWRRHHRRQTRINVEGTRNALTAARTAGVRRFIHFSTLSAYGHHPGRVTEATPSNAAGSSMNYERSKWQAEQCVERAAGNGMDTVVLCPAAILGPGDQHNWSRLFVALHRRQLPVLPKGVLSFNHVDEIVRVTVKAALVAPAGARYLLGGDDTSVADIVVGICALLGRKPPRLPAPKAMLYATGAALEALAPKQAQAEPLMTRDLAALLSASLLCDSSLAEQQLGLRSTPLQQCLEDCHDWLRAEGQL